MIKKLLFTFYFLLFTFLLSGCIPSSSTGSSLFPTPAPAKTGPTGQYCLTKEELEAIKSRPIAFSCNQTDYVLAAEDVEVKRIFIHAQKQLILKETCEGIDYYTWLCHPPSYGSIYSNTLWKLRDSDPNRKPLKDGDHFDVFLRKDAKDTENFVCKNGAGATALKIFSGPPMAEILADSPLKGKIIRVEDKSAIWYMRSDALKIDIETAPPRKKISEITLDGVTYDVFVNLLKAFSPDEDKNFYLVEKGILPEGNDNLPDSITYDVFSIVTEVKPKGLTLQLGTFDPRPPKNRWFDIYLPESKPVIYLYPQKPAKLTVKIEPKNGYLTVSDPPYDPQTGWQLLALPNGSLTLVNTKDQMLNTKYSYLYYESEVKGYQIPEQGFLVPKSDLESFFEEVLPKLGLNQKEATDFSEYWLGRLQPLSEPYLFITFLPQEQIEQIDPIAIEQSNNETVIPTTSIRIRAYFQPLDQPIDIKLQSLPIPPERKGFTLVEWGGILDD